MVDASPNCHSASDKHPAGAILLAVVSPPASPSKGLHPQLVGPFPSDTSFYIQLPDTLFSTHNRKVFASFVRFIAATLLWVLHQLVAVTVLIPKAALTAAAVSV